MTIKYLFYILIAICGAVAVYSLFSLLDSKNANASVKRRIKNIARDVDVEDVRNNVLKEKKEQKRKDSGLKFVSERLEAELATAGIKISGEEFLRIWVIVAFVPALLLLAFGLSVISALGIMLIGIIVPPLLVSNAKKKKNSVFDKQLGDALMVMSNSLRAGYTFQQSMDSIAKDMQPPISDEFRLVVREIDMGASLETALNHLVERTRNDDVKILVSAVLISATVG
ncbi:MAG: type II secretion system F family protein, partial [Eubacteriaceae bacterium]|nr:type II secretion system F family protein [Eubacteriaceae bacterium]